MNTPAIFTSIKILRSNTLGQSRLIDYLCGVRLSVWLMYQQSAAVREYPCVFCDSFLLPCIPVRCYPGVLGTVEKLGGTVPSWQSPHGRNSSVPRQPQTTPKAFLELERPSRARAAGARTALVSRHPESELE